MTNQRTSPNDDPRPAAATLRAADQAYVQARRELDAACRVIAAVEALCDGAERRAALSVNPHDPGDSPVGIVVTPDLRAALTPTDATEER